jgi:VWFA-related protein
MPSEISLLILTAAIASAAQQPPTFRVGTELVQVSVVAQDKQGKPVADLRREEFQLFDNRSPQEIRLFVGESEKSSPAATEPKAPNTFTNQVAAPAGSRSGYSVILIDSLATVFGDPFTEDGAAYARIQTLRMLQSIPVGERIAIYALQQKFKVICEFTSDRDLLERQLRAWIPSPNYDYRSEGPHADDPSPRVAAESERIDNLQKGSAIDGQMELVADHLAGVPGRKDLSWIGDRFAIGPRALQKLKDANVAIYPVDAAGAKGPPERRDPMRAIAAQTGGVAYFGRNDLDSAIREAMDDGRVSYTLGFYPAVDDSGPQVHQLAVRVSRPGVTLRYRTSYQTEVPQPMSANPKADLALVLNRPFDATALPVKAWVTRDVTRVQDRLNVQALLDVGSLDLLPNGGLWTGKIEVVARFTAADGSLAGEGFSQTMVLNLRQSTYEKALRDGFLYHNEWRIPAKAVEFKVLFSNLATGKLGTLTIPLSEIPK